MNNHKSSNEISNKQKGGKTALIVCIIVICVLVCTILFLVFGNKEEDEKEKKETRKLTKSESKSLILILASIALWYIGYNAVTSKYSLYAGRVLDMDYNTTLLIAQGAENIDLVTPTHYLPTILPALEPGLSVPVIYNCGGYERVETLKALEGKVDIYLPDLKYADRELGQTLSGAKNYFPAAKLAIKEMVRQTGAPKWEGERLVKGTVVRHLILPGQLENSLRVLDWLGDNFRPGEILVSLMRQYTPMEATANMPPFDRRITDEEYDAVLSWMYLNDLEGFVQEGEAADAAFIPDF